MSNSSQPPGSASHIFISYARANQPFVDRLMADLSGRGLSIWMDKQQLKAGTPNWEAALRTAIQGSGAVLLIATPDSRRSLYVPDELAIAALYKRPVYPVWAEGDHWIDSIRMGYGSVQYIDARGEAYPQALDQIMAALNAELIAPLENVTGTISAEPNFEPRNPYKGLNAFTAHDTADFFGRDSLIDTLTTAVQAMESARFLAIIGPSGAGKSSVMQAGLLPRLQTFHPNWIVLAPMRPDNAPLRELTVALARALPTRSNTAIREDLDAANAQGLGLLTRNMVTRPAQRVVLPIDQFEELFTQTADEAERRQFIDLLTSAVTESHGVLTVVITLRADFYDRPLAYPELGSLIERQSRTILPLTLADLRDAIERPAALLDVQLSFDDGLVADLVFEVREQIGGLPLLQFTLDQLFERREGHRLTQAAYSAIGGVRGALTKHAEGTYAALPSPDHQRMARILFLRLIEPGTSDLDTTRRRAPLTDLQLRDPNQTRILSETAEAFTVARLLTRERETIEVSHEALIREWPRLRDWLDDSRDDLRLQKRINQDAAGWVARGRKPADDGLYRGSVLDDAEHWVSHSQPSRDEADFLAASRQRVEAERRRDRIRQRSLNQARGGMVLAIVLIIILAGVFLTVNARQQTNTALALNAQGTINANQIAIASTAQGDAKIADTKIAFANTSIPSTLTYVAEQNSSLNNLIVAIGNNLTQPDQEIAAVSTSIADNPSFALSYITRGLLYNNQQQYDKALTDYTQAIILDPQNAIAYMDRGVIYASQQKYDKALALADFTQAITLDPTYALAYNDRGNVFGSQQKYANALADYTQAITLDPTYAIAYYNRGLVHYYQGQNVEALTDYNHAITFDPKYADAYHYRGLAFEALNLNDKALTDFQMYKQLVPTDTSVDSDIAQVQAALATDQSPSETPRPAATP